VVNQSTPFRLRIGLCFAIAVWGAIAASAQESGPLDDPREFILRPVSEEFFIYVSADHSFQEIAFKKEPEYTGNEVLRTALRSGDWYMGMAYDPSDGLLYLDRNQNLDLTDDGPGLPSQTPGYGEFRNIPVTLTHDGLAVQYALDINTFFTYYAYANIRSGWEGEIEIGGKTIQVGLADNLDGQFNEQDRFFFDHARHREARLSFGGLDHVNLPNWIYFEGRCYQIDFSFRSEGDETVVAATIQPITENLIELHFEGRHVSRVMIADRNNTGMLDWPDPLMKIPQGRYFSKRVDILDSFTSTRMTSWEFGQTSPAVLKTGGPLHKRIAITRSGPSLDLNYELAGFDETGYRTDNQVDNPAFAVYRGDRQVGEGTFRYG
jgi:hypothetical protein